MIQPKRKQAFEFEFITHNKKEFSLLLLKVISKEVGKQFYEATNTVGNKNEKEETQE